MWILYSHKYFIKHKHNISEECYVYVKEMKFHFHLFLLTLIVYCLYYLFSETQKKIPAVYYKNFPHHHLCNDKTGSTFTKFSHKMKHMGWWNFRSLNFPKRKTSPSACCTEEPISSQWVVKISQKSVICWVKTEFFGNWLGEDWKIFPQKCQFI